MVDSSLSQSFIKGEVHSKSSLPLLSYLLQSNPEKNPNHAKIFRNIIKDFGDSLEEIPAETRASGLNGIRDVDKEIPDESVLVETWMLELMKNGPGKKGQKLEGKPKVTIVGAGTSGLCAGYELKKAGFEVTILEASSRVGGRVKTFKEPYFAPGLHGEGGAMRIPKAHQLLLQYIDDFGLSSQLFNFEMENKFVYISGLRRTLVYGDGLKPAPGTFNYMLRNKDPELLALFPGLKDCEKGKTCDDLFNAAVEPVVNLFWEVYNVPDKKVDLQKLKEAYATITTTYDKYSLRSYLTDVAQWSNDAINLYDLGNAHVVFENGFIESWKDAFLSSNSGGAVAQMQQLQSGMDAVPNAFISPDRGRDSLIDDIKYGARVTEIAINPVELGTGGTQQQVVTTTYETNAGEKKTLDSDYLILAIPYTSQRAITKNRNFVPLQEMAVRDVRYVEVTKVLLQYKKRWWEEVYEKEGQGSDGGLVSDLPIRYTMFPKSKKEGNSQFNHSNRGVIMAAYTFEQDATILGALSPERRIKLAADNLDRIFPEANSLDYLEVGASQVFPSDELAGGSAFCYFGPEQKTTFLDTMMQSDWDLNGDRRYRVFFAGEQASYTHGWIQGAFEAGLRCVKQIWDVAVDGQNVQ